MSKPNHLITACGDTAELLKRVSALLTVRMKKKGDELAIPIIATRLNNLAAALARDERGEPLEEAVNSLIDSTEGQGDAIIAVSVLLFAGLILLPIADEENWSLLSEDKDESFKKKSMEILDDLIKEVQESTRKEENDE